MTADEGIAIGHVLRPWGRRGAVVVEPLTHDVGRFERLRSVWVARSPGSEEREVRAVRIDRHGRALVELAGVDTIGEAETLRGAELRVPETHAVRPRGDAYFNHELVGAEVSTADGRSLGRIARIIEGGGGDLLVARSADAEVLVPAVRGIVVDVDVADRRVVVDPPAGLVELNARGG